MARQVSVAPRAIRDLTKLYDYLEERAGQRVAQSYIDRPNALFELLADFPGIGAPRPELVIMIRSAGLWPYVVLYSVDEAAVNILRTVHGGRNITAKMLK